MSTPLIALIAAITMVLTDCAGVIMVQAESRNRGWLAGWMDTGQWIVGITTTFITVEALSSHDFARKVSVVVAVSLANLFGTKLGQVIGSKYVKDVTIEDRLSALEGHINR